MLANGKEIWRTENGACRARYNGQQAEESFSAICLRRGWHVYSPKVDEGVDFIVETRSGGIKKVQVTRAGLHIIRGKSSSRYIVNKKWDRIRKDVDLIAILCEEDTETGIVQHWFIVPATCYASTRFDKYHNTDNTWYINTRELRPPMDAALNAWWLFDRKNVSGKRILKTFLP